MAADLTNPIFTNEDQARNYLEQLRWPDGPYCAHCGATEGITLLQGKSHRPGLYQCNACREHFTVTVGTLYERSHIPLHKWLLATHLMCASKKGISAAQLHRMLGITYKTAWFMAHRIREAMREAVPGFMGGSGKAVQVDETYYGTKDAYRGKPWSEKKGHTKKMSVVALVSEGQARAFHIDSADASTIRSVLLSNVHPESELHTDQAYLYRKVGKEFTKHSRVHHDVGEYVSPTGATTNHVENFFSVFKRGMKGVYQHCSEKHLQRYLNEFEFRYNNRAKLEVTDSVRTDKALKGITGKRLTYKQPKRGGSNVGGSIPNTKSET